VPPRVAVCCWDGGWHDHRSTPRTLRRQHFGRQYSARCKAVEVPFAPVCVEAQGSSRRVSLRAGLWEAASMHSSCGSENRLYRLSQLIRLAGLYVANIGRRLGWHSSRGKYPITRLAYCMHGKWQILSAGTLPETSPAGRTVGKSVLFFNPHRDDHRPRESAFGGEATSHIRTTNCDGTRPPHSLKATRQKLKGTRSPGAMWRSSWHTEASEAFLFRPDEP
jgi:hypothetical protein